MKVELNKGSIELLLNHLNLLSRAYWAAETGRELLEKNPAFSSATKIVLVKSLYSQFIIGLSALFDKKVDGRNKNFSVEWFLPELAEELRSDELLQKLKKIRNKILAHRDLAAFTDVPAFITNYQIPRADSWSLLARVIDGIAGLAEKTVKGFDAQYIKNKLKSQAVEETKAQAEILFSAK